MAWSLEDFIRISTAAVLGGIGAAVGFRHTHDWAVENGQHGWIAWGVAVVVEGMALVAGFEIRRDHRAGRPSRFPISVFVAAFVLQMAAQVSQANDTPAGWLLAATPALGFLVVVKLLLRSSSATSVQPVQVDEAPAPVAAVADRQDVQTPELPAARFVDEPRPVAPPPVVAWK